MNLQEFQEMRVKAGAFVAQGYTRFTVFYKTPLEQERSARFKWQFDGGFLVSSSFGLKIPYERLIRADIPGQAQPDEYLTEKQRKLMVNIWGHYRSKGKYHKADRLELLVDELIKRVVSAEGLAGKPPVVLVPDEPAQQGGPAK